MPGTGEMLIIALLAIIVVDPKKLPDLMKSLGKAIGEFKQMSGEFKRTIERETEMADFEKRKAEAHEQLYGTKAGAEPAPEPAEGEAKPEARPEGEAKADAEAASEAKPESWESPEQPPVERAESAAEPGAEPAVETAEPAVERAEEAPAEAAPEISAEATAEAVAQAPAEAAVAPAAPVEEASAEAEPAAAAADAAMPPAETAEAGLPAEAEPAAVPAAAEGPGGVDVPPPPPPAGDDAVGEGHAGRMSLFGHLQDLRKRLTRCVIAVLVGFLASYAFAGKLLKILMQPMLDAIKQSHFIYTLPTEAFFTEMKIAFVAGIFLCSPYIFYQIWQFIAPGLYSHERKWILPIAFFSALCFSIGAFFGYFVVFPFGFEFFASYTNEYLVFTPKLDEYLDFVLKLLFAFGIVFELPLFLFFLARLGLVTFEGLRAKRKYAILTSFIVAAALTPPDAISQTMMAVPLCVLYEVGVWMAFFFGKKRKPAPAEEPAAPTGAA
ncbi:MAG: twin-arginine translocase subunit TatC [Desulfovibrio sp.]